MVSGSLPGGARCVWRSSYTNVPATCRWTKTSTEEITKVRLVASSTGTKVESKWAKNFVEKVHAAARRQPRIHARRGSLLKAAPDARRRLGGSGVSSVRAPAEGGGSRLARCSAQAGVPFDRPPQPILVEVLPEDGPRVVAADILNNDCPLAAVGSQAKPTSKCFGKTVEENRAEGGWFVAIGVIVLLLAIGCCACAFKASKED